MRFVRLQADVDSPPVALATLAAGGDLRFFELDYARPRHAALPAIGPPELPEHAASFPAALEALGPTLFLEPQTTVITSAGWSSSYDGAEQAARMLCQLGRRDVPVSAVRGSNLLPILDDLPAAGVKLDNVETGAAWRTLRAPILAADLRLGAGPLATALGEGSRVVVAGCYDLAAPTIAAAVVEHQWSWKQADLLAAAAVAARAAGWAPWRGPGAPAFAEGLGLLVHPRVELAANGDISVDLDRPLVDADAAGLLAWLRSGFGGTPPHPNADVQVRAESLQTSPAGRSQLRIAGVRGSAPTGRWRLEVLYQSGFMTEAVIEFAARTAPAVRRQVADAVAEHFIDPDDDSSSVAVHPLASTAEDAAGPSWLHVSCRSPVQKVCSSFVEQIAAVVAANSSLMRLPGGRPKIHVACRQWPASISQDVVDLAVDTRPAHEWA